LSSCDKSHMWNVWTNTTFSCVHTWICCFLLGKCKQIYEKYVIYLQ
jgi:hypothetical protein